MLAKWAKKLKDRKMIGRKMFYFFVIHFSVKIFLPKKQGFHFLGTNYPITNYSSSIANLSIILRNVPLSILSSFAVAIRFQLLRIRACSIARF